MRACLARRAAYVGDEPCGNSSLVVKSRDAYLANVETLKSGRGSASCPWKFAVSRGQAVNVTLVDFYAEMRQLDRRRDGSGNTASTCETHAVIRVGETEVAITDCGVRRLRVVHRFADEGDMLIAFNRSTQQEFYFLLHVHSKRSV